MNFIKKWYTYQKERFPVLIYSTYILAIVVATFCYANYIAKVKYGIVMSNEYTEKLIINYYKIIPMFIIGFLQFLMVRIVDEFKDYEEDCKYRPYRPVPRGLVTLKELKILLIICIILQVVITCFTNILSIIPLIGVWMFFAIMSKGFFIKKFLDKHILVEVFFDEMLMPVFVIFLTSLLPFTIPIYSMNSYLLLSEIWPLLFMSYVISWIVEIARKVRCKEDEEEGVKTYTAVFGIPKAMIILFVLETLLMLITTLILKENTLMFSIIMYAIANIPNVLFLVKQNKIFAKMTELTANLYVMICYFSLITLI